MYRNCILLHCISLIAESKRVLYLLQLEPNESKEKVLVFFKVRPEVITPDNLHTNTIVSTMVDSPLSTLYHAVQKIYAPLMLEDGKWSRTLDPKLQSLISELEAGLGTAIRKQDPSFKGKGDNADNLGSRKLHLISLNDSKTKIINVQALFFL